MARSKTGIWHLKPCYMYSSQPSMQADATRAADKTLRSRAVGCWGVGEARLAQPTSKPQTAALHCGRTGNLLQPRHLLRPFSLHVLLEHLHLSGNLYTELSRGLSLI